MMHEVLRFLRKVFRLWVIYILLAFGAFLGSVLITFIIGSTLLFSYRITYHFTEVDVYGKIASFVMFCVWVLFFAAFWKTLND